MSVARCRSGEVHAGAQAGAERPVPQSTPQSTPQAGGGPTDGPTGGPDSADALVALGRLLGGHTWRDSRDWARALDQLSRLPEQDLDRVANAVPTPAAT